MPKPHLRACPSCARHVRVSEQACPFCRAALDPAFRASPAPRAPAARLTRAALFAFGTGALVVPAAACNSSSTPDTAAVGLDAGYGIPPQEDAGPGNQNVDAAYGAPGWEPDASDDAPSLIDAAYGAPGWEPDASDAAPDAPTDAGETDSGHD